MDRQKVFIGSDHAGFELKQAIIEALEQQGWTVTDIGPDTYDKDDDYPDYIIPTAEAVVDENSLGIVLGGSGQGEAIAANKIDGIRAAVYYGGEDEIVELSRRHNNANILSLGARFLEEQEAIQAVERWLGTAFSKDERHERRIRKIARYEDDTDHTISDS